MKLMDYDWEMISQGATQVDESVLNESDVYKLYVDSSNIKAIWFKDTMSGLGIGSLYVEFTSGAVYEYRRFTEKRFNLFLRAESYGKFFWKYIRGKYPYRRLKVDETE